MRAAWPARPNTRSAPRPSAPRGPHEREEEDLSSLALSFRNAPGVPGSTSGHLRAPPGPRPGTRAPGHSRAPGRPRAKLGKCNLVMFATAPETAFGPASFLERGVARALKSKTGKMPHRTVCDCPRDGIFPALFLQWGVARTPRLRASMHTEDLLERMHTRVRASVPARAGGDVSSRARLEGTPRGRRRQLERQLEGTPRGHASRAASGDVSEQLEGTPRGRRQLEGAPRGRRRQLERRCQRAYGNASMPAGSACADAHTRGCKRARMRRRQRRRGTTAPARPRACQHPAVPAGWQRHRCLFCPLLGWRTGNRSLLRWRPRLAGSWPAASRHATTMRQSLAATRLGPPGELPPGPRRGRNKSS